MDLYYLSLAGQLAGKLCVMPGETTDEMVMEQAQAKAAALERAARLRQLRQALAGLFGPVVPLADRQRR